METVWVAPLAGSVDRNTERDRPGPYWIFPSLPSRGAWIEIGRNRRSCPRSDVAPLAGSVDRNYQYCTPFPPMKRRSPRGERG